MDVSQASQRLRYHVPGPVASEDDCEKTFWLKTSLDRNINLSGAINFVVPPDFGAFTDLNAAYVTLTFQVFHADGSVLGEGDQVFLSPGSLQAIFRSVQISLNGAPLEPSNAYNWAATLTSYLGMSKTAREDVWSRLAGMRLPKFGSSKLLPQDLPYFQQEIKKLANSAEVTLTGRLMSDFTQSVAQLLPPGIKLEVAMTRNPDSVPLCSCTEDPTVKYKLDIASASLFLRRVRLSPTVMSRTLESIAGGASLSYTRLGVIINQVPATGVSCRVGNIFGGGPIPHTIYLVLANQQGYAGSQRYLGNFMESGYLRSLQVFENGRPVLTQPMRVRYVYMEDGFTIDEASSDGTAAFLSVTQALGGIANTNVSASLSYDDFLRGCIVYCVQINSCGGRRTAPGFVDVELEIDERINREPMNLLCFGEYDKTIKLDKNLQVTPH